MPFFRIRDELCVDGALVMRGEHRAIVPSALRSQLVHTWRMRHTKELFKLNGGCVTYSGGLRWMPKCNPQFFFLPDLPNE